MDKNIAMKLEGQHSLGAISPPSFVRFMMTNGVDEAMRITKDGVWVNPSLTVDEAANAVIEALDKHIKALVEREKAQRDELLEACEMMISDAYSMSEAMEAMHLAIAKAKGE